MSLRNNFFRIRGFSVAFALPPATYELVLCLELEWTHRVRDSSGTLFWEVSKVTEMILLKV